MFSALLAAASAAPAAAVKVVPAIQATLPPVTYDTTPHSYLATHLPWMTHIFGGLFAFLGVLLVVLLALQTTKQEGLSGTVGGRVESTTRRLGLDAQIARVTQTVAVAFAVVATIVSLSGI